MSYMKRKWNFVLPTFQNTIQIVKNNDFKRIRLILSCSKEIALLHGISSKHKGDFYCLNCLHSFRAKDKLKSH